MKRKKIEHNNDIDLTSEETGTHTRGTVLIPDMYFEHYSKKLNTLSTQEYFEILLKKYRYFLSQDLDAVAKKLNVDYQCEGLDLHQSAIYVSCDVWAELKMWRTFLNWSVCRIVTFLVHLDYAGVAEHWPERFKSLIEPEIPKFVLRCRAFYSNLHPIFARRFGVHRFDYG